MVLHRLSVWPELKTGRLVPFRPLASDRFASPSGGSCPHLPFCSSMPPLFCPVLLPTPLVLPSPTVISLVLHDSPSREQQLPLQQPRCASRGFYVTHFLGSYTGVAGLAVILLFFFYYFAVILLLGAEINAFFVEGVRATPDNLAVMVHTMTSHLPTSQRAMQEQASVSHKHEEPKEILPKSEVNHLEAQAAKATQVTNAPGQVEPTSTREDHAAHQGEKRKPSAKGSSRALTIVEAIAGISLAFIVQLFGLRRKKK